MLPTAPIVVFAYKRADHLSRCLESLAANAEAARSDLYVICDGPRSQADLPAVEAVRRLITRISGFASVTPFVHEANRGLARSIIDGVSTLLVQHQRLIIIEDDMVLSRHFLRYMNEALERYADDERVASIHGWCYPVAARLPETFFLRGADCWGWATWRRAWRRFNADGAALLRELQARQLTSAFDFDGAYPYTRMLADQIAGLNDSWAVRWRASCFLQGLLTLFPGRSLVHNIGNDGSGTHSPRSTRLDVAVASAAVEVADIPVQESELARATIARFLRPSLLRSTLRALRDMVRHSTAETRR